MFLISLASALLAPAQTQSLSVNQILDRHVQALGGQKNIDAVHTVVEHLEYQEGPHVNPNAFLARMRPYYKTIADPNDKNPGISEGYDGSAWEYYSDPGVVIRTVGAAAASTRHGLEIFDSLVDYKLLGTRVELSGLENFAGAPAYRLRVTLSDGYEKELFVDPNSFLIVGDRRAAPIHAFGEPVRSENRISDYRRISGVMFPFSVREIEVATGKELNSVTVQSLTVNRELEPSFFGPPQYQRSPLQQMLEQLYEERADAVSVLFTYQSFRRANPTVETADGVGFIGYQMVKMGDFKAAIELLTANAADYPKAAGAQFGLGRAYKATGDLDNARIHFQKALDIDPTFEKAQNGLNALK